MNAARPGEIYGTPGGSLDDYQSWGSGDQRRADIGKRGEINTAAILDRIALKPGGPTVLHDIKIPLKNITANIDHVVVSGRHVLIIDSKVWKPGRYWTFGGTSRRGFEKVPHVQKKTMEMAHDALSGFFTNKRIACDLATPVLVVWPSSTKKPLNTRFLAVPGATVLSPEKLEGRRGLGQVLSRRGLRSANNTADPEIVAALAQLLN